MTLVAVPPCGYCGERFYDGLCFHVAGCPYEDRSMWRLLVPDRPVALGRRRAAPVRGHWRCDTCGGGRAKHTADCTVAAAQAKATARNAGLTSNCGHCDGPRVGGKIVHTERCRITVARKSAPCAA